MHELYALIGLTSNTDNRGCPVPPVQQLLLVLRYFAAESFQIVAGDLVHVGQPTVSRYVAAMSRAIASLLPRFVKLPRPAEIANVRAGFHAMLAFSVRQAASMAHTFPFQTLAEKRLRVSVIGKDSFPLMFRLSLVPS